MTEERHRDLRGANIPMLKITDWAASRPQEMQSRVPEDISPLSRDDRDNDISTSPSRPNILLSPTTEEVVDTNTISSVPTSKLMQVEPDSRPAWLEEIRKIIQDEGHALMIEGIKKLAQLSETQGIGSISSAAGSVVSSPRPSQSQTIMPDAITNETAADETATNRRTVRFSDRHIFPMQPSGAIRTTSSSQPAADWGQLFDGNGYATLRLGQVLRGIAKHIIDDYAPKNSMVITPEKLANFYINYRLESEVYPFIDIFTSKASDANDPLADFYDDLECQHHLVQKDFHSRPSLPALTPVGFAQYLTICILAYPDEEFRRLERIVVETTLTADTITRDGQAERLPKTILRSCLPAKYDLKNRKLLDSAIDDLMYDLSLQSSSSRLSNYTVSGSEKRGNLNTSYASLDHSKRVSQRPNGAGEEQRLLEYGARDARKRFTPGTLQTIGDESTVESYDSSHNWDPDRENSHQRAENASTVAISTDSTKLPGGDSQYLASSPNTFYHTSTIPQRPNLPGPGARSQSYSHPRASFSPTIPPPPIGPHASVTSNFTSSQRRMRSPQRRGYSASVPNVSTNISSSSSSTAVFTPSTYSSASVSPTAEHGVLANLPSHYQNQRRDLHDNPTHQAATMTKHDNHYQPLPESNSNLGNTGAGPHHDNSDDRKITAGGGSLQTDASWAVMAPKLERKLERRPSQRHQHSAPSVESVSDADDHGLTWGEYLKGQQEKVSEQKQNRTIGYHGDR